MLLVYRERATHRSGMDDDSPADDGVLAEERDVLVGDVERDGAVAVRLDVAEVTDVSLGCVRSTVLGSRGLCHGGFRKVKRSGSAQARPNMGYCRRIGTHVEVRSSRRASVTVVTELSCPLALVVYSACATLSSARYRRHACTRSLRGLPGSERATREECFSSPGGRGSRALRWRRFR